MVYDSEGDRARCEGRTVWKTQVVWRARGYQHHGRRSAKRRRRAYRHHARGSVRSQRVFCPRDLPVVPPPQYIRPPTSHFFTTTPKTMTNPPHPSFLRVEMKMNPIQPRSKRQTVYRFAPTDENLHSRRGRRSISKGGKRKGERRRKRGEGATTKGGPQG